VRAFRGQWTCVSAGCIAGRHSKPLKAPVCGKYRSAFKRGCAVRGAEKRKRRVRDAHTHTYPLSLSFTPRLTFIFHVEKSAESLILIRDPICGSRTNFFASPANDERGREGGRDGNPFVPTRQLSLLCAAFAHSRAHPPAHPLAHTRMQN